MNFPVFNTKRPGTKEKFDLNSPAGRHQYFHDKVGQEIEEIKEYLEHQTFVGFLLAKKQAGKGTYSKMFAELIGSERFEHLSIGDLVRKVHQGIEDLAERDDLYNYLHQNYRGFISVDEAMDAFLGRSTQTLIPTEFILTLVRREIENAPRKAFFIDGFPRSLDQVSYSLYFREIMNLRDDPDFFVLIDLPESVIDARMKARVVCPICQTSRNTNLLPTKFVTYQQDTQQFQLICDNPECSGHGERIMEGKEGDELGIEAIRERIEMDGELISRAYSLHGVPRVLLRNSIPVSEAEATVDPYEITPAYKYHYNEQTQEVEISEEPWIIPDDQGVDSFSLLAAPVVLSLIVQIHAILGLKQE